MIESKLIKKLKSNTIAQKKFSKKQQEIIKELVYKFVVNSPSDKQSYVGNKYKDYGLSGYKLTKLLNNIKGKFKNCDIQYNYLTELFDKANFKMIMDHFSSKSYTQIVIFRGERGRQTKNLFEYLRNALAHGNFIISTTYIRIWNLSLKKNLNMYIFIKHENLELIWKELQKLI